jgi:hypothetical protein
MPRFKVWLTSDEPIAAKNALTKAQIPTIGPTLAGFVRGDNDWVVGLDMWAVLDAENGEHASSRVERAVRPTDIGIHACEPIDGGGEGAST